jgi:hypothetical protein
MSHVPPVRRALPMLTLTLSNYLDWLIWEAFNQPNRRIRTRTYGGVGGVGPLGPLLSRVSFTELSAHSN